MGEDALWEAIQEWVRKERERERGRLRRLFDIED